MVPTLDAALEAGIQSGVALINGLDELLAQAGQLLFESGLLVEAVLLLQGGVGGNAVGHGSIHQQ